MKYQIVIIGAGLSGLAAGIRLAHFGKRVLIIESHTKCGGLNSYYRKNGYFINTGLHAMTNYAERGERGAPLTKLLRQLRIPYHDLGLAEQLKSSIQFPGCSLTFTNDPSILREDIAKKFPDQVEGFDRLSNYIDEFDGLSLDPPRLSGRKEISRFLSNPLLVEMILEPLMYYGNPAENDMDFAQLVVLWKSILTSGFARPEKGMKHVIDLLLSRYKESGGEIFLGTGVKEFKVNNKRIESIVLLNGKEVLADQVISSIGSVETARLCSNTSDETLSDKIGKISFVEFIIILDSPPREFGLDKSIIFFNNEKQFTYNMPDELIDLSSGVICIPDNFKYKRPLKSKVIKVTVRASYEKWWEAVKHENPGNASQQTRQLYSMIKKETEEKILREILRRNSNFRKNIVFTDLFTPLTIKYYTRHENGAVYGSPFKQRDGITTFDNLFICGTDQGFLGITGSMLSGILIANKHCLK